MKTFDFEKFKETRRLQRNVGIGILIASLILLILVPTPCPIPPRHWASAAILGLTAVLSIILIGYSKRLPINETIQLASDKGGQLTVTDVSLELNVSPDVAYKILRILEGKEIARVETDDSEGGSGSMHWVFPDIQSQSRAQRY